MQVWDSFPPEERRRIIQSRLTPGRVLLLHCSFTKPPKDKFLVLASVEPKLLFFVVNSSINEYVRKHEALLRCKVEIGTADHPFLHHASFVDCTTAYRIALNDVYEQLEADIDRLKDPVSTVMRDQIIAAVKFSKTLTAGQKADILSAFDQEA